MLLTLDVARWAYSRGLARSGAGRARAGTHRYGWAPDHAEQRRVDDMSAVAECEVAAATGRRWLSSGVVPDDRDDGDVEGGLQVRWTSRRNGCLIVHDEDPDEHLFVLVVGDAPDQLIVGYTDGATAKERLWWREDVRHPAYFVPQRILRPIDDLVVRRSARAAS